MRQRDEGRQLAATIEMVLRRCAKTPDELATLYRQFGDGTKAIVVTSEGGGQVELATIDREAGVLVFDVTVADVGPDE